MLFIAINLSVRSLFWEQLVKWLSMPMFRKNEWMGINVSEHFRSIHFLYSSFTTFGRIVWVNCITQWLLQQFLAQWFSFLQIIRYARIARIAFHPFFGRFSLLHEIVKLYLGQLIRTTYQAKDKKCMRLKGLAGMEETVGHYPFTTMRRAICFRNRPFRSIVTDN